MSLGQQITAINAMTFICSGKDIIPAMRGGTNGCGFEQSLKQTPELNGVTLLLMRQQ